MIHPCAYPRPSSSKVLTGFLLLLASNITIGQTSKEVRRAIKKVENPSQVDDLRQKHPDWGISVFVPTKDDSTLVRRMGIMQLGEDTVLATTSGTYLYKWIHVAKGEEFRVSYVYLNGNSLSKSEIDSLRTLIIQEYTNGTSFPVLANKHTMDGNTTGDLGWFDEGMMVPEFESAVRTHRKGEIFTVDIPKNNWYYVVLKTHHSRTKYKMTFLKIKCDQNAKPK